MRVKVTKNNLFCIKKTDLEPLKKLIIFGESSLKALESKQNPTFACKLLLQTWSMKMWYRHRRYHVTNRLVETSSSSWQTIEERQASRWAPAYLYATTCETRWTRTSSSSGKARDQSTGVCLAGYQKKCAMATTSTDQRAAQKFLYRSCQRAMRAV